MGTSRSESPLGPVLGLLLLGLGLAGMVLAASLTRDLGLRLTLMAGELGLVLPGLIALGGRTPLAETLALQRLGVRSALLSVVAGAALWVFSLGLMNVQVLFWKPPEVFLETFRELHRALRPRNPLDAMVSVVAIAILPATCEELLFRGVVLPSFLRTTGPLLAVGMSALLFGVIHVQYLPGQPLMLDRVPFAIAVGVFLGLLRLRSASLWPPVIAHATLNTLTFVVVLAMGAAQEPTAEGRLDLGLGLLATGAAVLYPCLRGVRPAEGRPSAG
jgi:membrane protease YdiL (CAAX protease family)